MVWKHIFFICIFLRQTQQNPSWRTALVYKGNEKYTFPLSSPLLSRATAPYQTQDALLKIQGPPANVLTHHLTLDFRFVAWSASWRSSFPKFQLVHQAHNPAGMSQSKCHGCLTQTTLAHPQGTLRSLQTHLPLLQNLHITATTVLSHFHDHYSDFVQVYTDDSKMAHRTGSGIYIPQYNIKKTIEINRHSSILTSERFSLLSIGWLFQTYAGRSFPIVLGS